MLGRLPLQPCPGGDLRGDVPVVFNTGALASVRVRPTRTREGRACSTMGLDSQPGLNRNQGLCVQNLCQSSGDDACPDNDRGCPIVGSLFRGAASAVVHPHRRRASRALEPRRSSDSRGRIGDAELVRAAGRSSWSPWRGTRTVSRLIEPSRAKMAWLSAGGSSAPSPDQPRRTPDRSRSKPARPAHSRPAWRST